MTNSNDKSHEDTNTGDTERSKLLTDSSRSKSSTYGIYDIYDDAIYDDVIVTDDGMQNGQLNQQELVNSRNTLDVSDKENVDETNNRSLPIVKTKVYVFVSHFLSKWGDRMWMFGVGLFLINLSPDSLRLTAIYGFASGGSVLLFGAVIGDWVDNTPRLKAARLSLVLQNLSVALCAVVVCFVFWYNSEIADYWPDMALLQICHALIIIIAVISNLASIAGSIAKEKDWLPAICAGDKDLLASMSATMRCIDQTSMILAPALTGQIIAYANLGYGAVFIGAWNIVSVVVEYYLIWKVYESVPSLRKKMYKTKKEDEKESTGYTITTETDSLLRKGRRNHNSNLSDGEVKGRKRRSYSLPCESNTTSKKSYTYSCDIDTSSIYMAGSSCDDITLENDDSPLLTDYSTNSSTSSNKSCKECCSSTCRNLFRSVITLYIGWKTYKNYNVASAGIGLACLFMTVLGFDNITVGYAYLQGVNESLIGVLMAAGALCGILGTVAYPIMRRHLGLERTGLFGLCAQILTLSACVVAVWAPGSPFDPLYLFRSNLNNLNTTSNPEVSNITNSSTTTRTSIEISSVRFFNITQNDIQNITTAFNIDNTAEIDMFSTNNLQTRDTTQGILTTLSSNQTTAPAHVTSSFDSYLSIGLLLGGIVTARFGLWLADLTISQLFLENVVETERGIVNGVQNSLNQVMDMLKFLLVILVPQPEMFGYLILLSFAFVCMGFILYARYTYSVRGHFFHFDKIYNWF